MTRLPIRIRAPQLRAIREVRGLTRRQLALMAGITPPELGFIEAGGQVTDDQVRMRLLQALDAAFDHVFRLERRY